MAQPKVAFVSMRYGRQINGGAELLCRLIAERMVRHWQVHVLTTCAIDYVAWKDELPPGDEDLDGVKVHRFPVTRERPIRWFNRIYNVLYRIALWSMPGKFVKNDDPWKDVKWPKVLMRYTYMFIFGPYCLGPLVERLWMWLQGPLSNELNSHIATHAKYYDAFVFFTNTYATTYYNVFKVADRAIVVPAAHDEVCFYFKIFDRSTKKAKALIYSTPEEKALFEGRFPFAAKIANRVTGVGVEEREPGSAARFRSKYGIAGDYVIYVGRIEELKGCKELFHMFNKYRSEKRPDLKLVLVGKPVMQVPDLPGIHSLGFVSEEDKYDAIAGAACLIMPSPYESLSIVLLEAWMSKIPVIVNGECEVLKGQCDRAKGGYAYTDYGEFEQALDKMLSDRDASQRMAESGYQFTKKTYIWSKIEQDYKDMLQVVTNKR